MKDRIIEHYRPDTITRDLITNEDEINKIKKATETHWDYVFAESPDNQDGDEKVKHRMSEVDTPATYETEVDYYDPTTIQIETEITGKKKWFDDTLESRPDSITIYLFGNGQKIKEQIISARTHWTYRFTNIPVYDAMGERITYTVREKTVVGYKTTYEGFDIINMRMKSIDESQKDEEGNILTTSRATRIGLFVLGAAAITAGLLFDQIKKEE